MQLAHLDSFKDEMLVGPRNPRDVNLVRLLPSFTVDPPDPFVDSEPFEVDAWYKTRIFVCALFHIDSSFIPFCPQCNSRESRHRGWSGFRRVVDVDRVCYAVTRRYECKNACCGVEYLGWDERILECAPAHIRMTFPVILTHRLAVTEAVFDQMRSCLDAGTGSEPFAKMIEEQHRRRYDRCRLAYLSRVSALRKSPQTGQTSMDPELQKEPPVFSAYDDPEGFGGVHVTAKYLRTLYTSCMRVLEGHMKRKNANVSAKILSGDHFFKILRCNFTFGGSRSFEAAYSLVNEHSEVIAVVLTQSKSLEEIRAMLVGVAKRMVALGHPKDHITLFYTDNPVAEKSFLLSIFDGLHRGAAVPKQLPLLSTSAAHTIFSISTDENANRLVRLMREELDEVVKAGKQPVVSLDTEWTVSGSGKHRRLAPTQVIQLSTAKRTLVIHVARTGIPHELKGLLGDDTVLKVGRGIAVDVSRLKKHSPSVSVRNYKDVGAFAKELGLVPRANMSLVAMCEQLLRKTLDKTEQVGHWGGDLTDAQIRYAAMDSYACWCLYESMLSCGSRFIDPDMLTPNQEVVIVDASGSQVARATIAAEQPAASARRVARDKRRFLVEVVEVLVPAFVLPFARSPAPTTLGDLWHNAALGGPHAAFVVLCRQLRDANHPMEVSVVAGEPEERLRVPAVGHHDGVFDAHAEVALDADRLQAIVSAGGAAAWGADEDADEEEGDALGDVVEEDGDLPELDVELTDAADWAVSGVKADPMHVMDRILRVMPKNHGALALFSRRLSQAMMLSNLKDALAAKAVAAKLWPNTPWAEILFRRSRWLHKRVRRFIPAPDILSKRIEAVFAEFEHIVDASTGSLLFTPNALKAYRAVLKLAKSGAVSDDPATPLYSLLAFEKDKLPLWLCSRGTNANEGGVHQKLVKNFLSMRGASPELVHYALLEWVHRNNVRAASRNRGVPFPGHYDTWLVDRLCKLEEEIYGRRLSFSSWQCADDYSLPPFCCGVVPMEQSVISELGLPVGDKLIKARTLLERVSSQMRWLSCALGSELPLVPVHTVDDIKLYHSTHKRLVEVEERRRQSAAPGNEAMVIAADCDPSIEQLTVGINEAVTLHWMKVVEANDTSAPSVFFKTFDHVRTYQARFERSRNVMSTLIVHEPTLRRDSIAAAEGYLRFGPPAAPTDAVHPPQTGGGTAGPVGDAVGAAAGFAGDGGDAAVGPAGGEGGAAALPVGGVGSAGAGPADGADGGRGGGGAAAEGLGEDPADHFSEHVPPPAAGVLPLMDAPQKRPAAQERPVAQHAGLLPGHAALLPPFLPPGQLWPLPGAAHPMLTVGLVGQQTAAAPTLPLGTHPFFFMPVLPHSVAAAASTATSAVAASPVGHSSAPSAPHAGAAGASSSCAAPSLQQSSSVGQPSSAQEYVPVPRRIRKPRKCTSCLRPDCVGRGRGSCEKRGSDVARQSAPGAPGAASTPGSTSARISSSAAESGSDSGEPPAKAPSKC